MVLPRDHIDIESLACRCIIGTLPHERVTPQALTADVRLWLDLTEAALTGSLARTTDYGVFSTQAAFVLDHGHFRLLESAALCLVRLALSPDPGYGAMPSAARVTLRKPHILPIPAVPAVTVERRGDEVAFAQPRAGTTEVFSCPETRVLRVIQAAKPAGTAVLAGPPGHWLVVDRLG
jgi:FolB domain-containing protein